MQNLVKSRLANQTIFKESETLLTESVASGGSLSVSGGALSRSFFEFLFIAGALYSLYLLIRVYGAEAQRRRLESERENKRNQEAILRLLNECRIWRMAI